MKFLHFVMVFFACFLANATNVQFQLADPQFSVSQVTNVQVVVQAETPSQAAGGFLMLPFSVSQFTDLNGQTTFTNLYGSSISGYYHWTVPANSNPQGNGPAQTAYGDIWVQSTNLGVVQASAILTSSTNVIYPGTAFAWDASASDARYSPIFLAGTNLNFYTNGGTVYLESSSSYSLAPGTNIVLTTNSGVVTINSTASGASLTGVITNGYTSQFNLLGQLNAEGQGINALAFQIDDPVNPLGAKWTAVDQYGNINAHPIGQFNGNGAGITNVTAANGLNPAQSNILASAVTNLFAGKTLWVDPYNGLAIGVRGDQAKPYNSIPNALSNALSGDSVVVFPSTNYVGTNSLRIPKNVSFAPLIPLATTIVSLADENTNGCIINPGDNCFIGAFVIQATNVQHYQGFVGAVAGTPNNTFTNVIVNGLIGYGDADGWFLNETTNLCSIQFWNCEFNTAWDVSVTQGNASHFVEFYNCMLRVRGSSKNIITFSSMAHGPYLYAGTNNLFNCTVDINGPGVTVGTMANTNEYGIVGAGGVMNLVNTAILVPTNISCFKIYQNAGVVNVYGSIGNSSQNYSATANAGTLNFIDGTATAIASASGDPFYLVNGSDVFDFNTGNGTLAASGGIKDANTVARMADFDPLYFRYFTGANSLSTGNVTLSGALTNLAKLNGINLTNIPSTGITGLGTASASNASAFYLSSNPSGYISGLTAAMTNNLIAGATVTNSFYPTSNPSFFAPSNTVVLQNGAATNITLVIPATSIFVSGSSTNGAELVVTNSNPAGWSGLTAQADNGTFVTNYVGIYENNSQFVPGTGYVGSTNDGVLEFNGKNAFVDLIGGSNHLYFVTRQTATNVNTVTNIDFSTNSWNFQIAPQYKGIQLLTNVVLTSGMTNNLLAAIPATATNLFALTNDSRALTHTNGLNLIGGNGSWLTNLPAAQLTGTMPLGTLPNVVVTNGALSVATLSNIVCSQASSTAVTLGLSSSYGIQMSPYGTVFRNSGVNGAAASIGNNVNPITGTYFYGFEVASNQGFCWVAGADASAYRAMDTLIDRPSAGMVRVWTNLMTVGACIANNGFISPSNTWTANYFAFTNAYWNQPGTFGNFINSNGAAQFKIFVSAPNTYTITPQ